MIPKEPINIEQYIADRDKANEPSLKKYGFVLGLDDPDERAYVRNNERIFFTKTKKPGILFRDCMFMDEKFIDLVIKEFNEFKNKKE